MCLRPCYLTLCLIYRPASPASKPNALGATDPRDIVFGHLGVLSDRDRYDSSTKIDYDRDLAHVSVDAARYFLDATGIESLLLHAMKLSTVKFPEIPSWCPRCSRLQALWENIHKVGKGKLSPSKAERELGGCTYLPDDSEALLRNVNIRSEWDDTLRSLRDEPTDNFIEKPLEVL